MPFQFQGHLGHKVPLDHQASLVQQVLRVRLD
jgi:hypothetical protein